MALEVVGPRVSVDRNGTGDRGGGQLVCKQGKLLVRTRNIERLLSTLPAIDHIQLIDLARLNASVRLVDGQIWNVQSEQGEDLTVFFRQLESLAGSTLLREPPRISQLVREAATPARGRLALMSVIALLAYFPLRFVGGLARPAGLAILVLGGLALLLGVLALAQREDEGPAWLTRVRRWAPLPWLAAALAACVAGALGQGDASARVAREIAETRAQAVATQRAESAAAQQKAEARARSAQLDALSAQLLAATQGERFRDAGALQKKLQALAPDHPTLAQTRPQLERALAELDERERVEGVARGIVQARAIAADPLACETAKRVADTHELLRHARPEDADYAAAQRALPALERCRVRVGARFAQSAEDGRRRRRVMAAAQIEPAVRRLGYPVNVTLAGHDSDVLRIEARELDAGAAQRILALSEGQAVTFEAARKDEGFARIELRGEELKRDVELNPVSPEALVLPVLETFGLAAPLASK